MKIVFLLFICVISLFATELKIKADSFFADDKKGISIFQGNVNVRKLNSEINASKVVIYTNKQHQPTKFEASGGVYFHISTQNGALYNGHSKKIMYIPNKREYHFYGDVLLNQIDKKKVIIGEEIVLEGLDGKAYAKGKESEPVIMIFDIPDKKGKK